MEAAAAVVVGGGGGGGGEDASNPVGGGGGGAGGGADPSVGVLPSSGSDGSDLGGVRGLSETGRPLAANCLRNWSAKEPGTTRGLSTDADEPTEVVSVEREARMLPSCSSAAEPVLWSLCSPVSSTGADSKPFWPRGEAANSPSGRLVFLLGEPRTLRGL